MYAKANTAGAKRGKKYKKLPNTVNMFQVQYLVENDPNAEKSLEHHKSGSSTQKTFRTEVLKLADAIKALGNPFQGDVEELVNIGTGDCPSEELLRL